MTLLTCFSYYIIILLSCYPPVATSFNLSTIESAVLKSRLDRISNSAKEEFKSISSDDTPNNMDTFIFPGAGGVDELVLDLNEKTPGSKVIDWREHCGSILTAAYDGEAVGVAISDILLKSGPEKPLHFIGISVGAFCANAAATSVFMRQPNRDVRLTLLDPFCGRGVFGPNYGNEHFGKYATTAIQILNTDDPVPTTNDPLPNCVCFDVTNDPQRADFVPPPGDSMHSWPVAYFARHFIEPTELRPRGSIIIS
jgi:hypothetical protein